MSPIRQLLAIRQLWGLCDSYESYPTVTKKNLQCHYWATVVSLFCTTGIPFCLDELFSSSCFSPPNRDEKVNWKLSKKYISIDQRYFYGVFTTRMMSYVKKINKCLCRSHRRCSAKKMFLKNLQYSHENTCIGVSLQTFRFAVLLTSDTNSYIFLQILRNFKGYHFEEPFQMTTSYFMNKHWNNSSKKN